MDIVKIATEWAKAEILSAQFFILFGVLFILAAIGFWQVGATDVAKAFIFPSLIAGALLVAAGSGFYVSNQSRLSNFEADYKADPSAFVEAEIARAEKTMGEYQNIAFKVFPAIIVLAAFLIIFVSTPMWRAIGMMVIAFMLVLLVLDSNANARMENYHQQLGTVEKTGE